MLHALPKELKVKSFFDMECKVMGYKSGSGKFKGMLGSLIYKPDNNTTFNTGSGFSVKQRKNP